MPHIHVKSAHLAFFVALGKESKISCILGKHSSAELYTQSSTCLFILLLFTYYIEIFILQVFPDTEKIISFTIYEIPM